MRLTPAERELIEMLRAGKPFGCTIMLQPDGEWVASTSRPPFDDGSRTLVGIAPTFEEAWLGRQQALPGARAN